MSIPINRIVFFNNQNLKDTNEKTSGPGSFVGVEKEVFYMYADGNNVKYKIEMSFLGEWRVIAEGTAKADKLHVVDVEWFMPYNVRMKVTATVANTKFTATAHGSPAVYASDNPGDPGDLY